jgi:hypothetical protein
VKKKQTKDSDEGIVSKTTRRRLKKRYNEIKKEEEEKEKIKDAWNKLKQHDQRKKVEKIARKAVEKIDVILKDDSSSEKRKKRQRKDPSSTSSSPPKRQYKVRAFRIKGQDRSSSEERPVLTEKGEDDIQDETQREVHPVTTRTPPHQRESGTPQSQSERKNITEEMRMYARVHLEFPDPSDEGWKTFLETNRMMERSHQEGREYLEEREERIREEFRQRLLNCTRCRTK